MGAVIFGGGFLVCFLLGGTLTVNWFPSSAWERENSMARAETTTIRYCTLAGPTLDRNQFFGDK